MELKVKVDNKKVFNRIGLATFVTMILVSIIQVMFFGVIAVIDQELLSAPWVNYASIAISFYLIGFPVFYLMIKNLPEEEKRESKTLGVFEVIKICFMSYSIVYIVNFLTNILMMLIAVIKGSEVTNPLVNMLEGSNWIWSLIFAGILSPIIEEMMFRGVMLNKLRRYGDKVAIITTAILFGLFHANFSQFFYAVALGIVFAYVTLKTGTIKYSIILHIIVNMMGSVILPAVIGDGSNIVAVGCVGLALLAIVIVGLVLLIKNRKNVLTVLNGDGDFRSEESIELLKESDIVVTNPPFSLFREYVAQLIENEKKFIIIGNTNSLTYKEIFKLIKEDRIRTGYTNFNVGMYFFVPDECEKYHKIENGRKLVRVSTSCWFTNLPVNKHNQEITLYKKYTPEEYPKYHNFDAINIGTYTDIPYDYDGMMGVPITFIDKYNPEQFEIIGLGISKSGTEIGVRPYTEEHKTYRKKVQKKGAVDGDLYMIDENGHPKVPYARVIIKRKIKVNSVIKDESLKLQESSLMEKEIENEDRITSNIN